MNIAGLYRNLKRILNESNTALANKGLDTVNTFSEIPSEIEKLGEINNLPYVLRGEIIEVNEDDFGAGDIRPYALYMQTSLESVTIPDSVTSIGDRTFDGCSSLANMYIHSTTPPALHSTISSHTTIHVPIGCGDAYKNATNWSNFANNIVDDIVAG